MVRQQSTVAVVGDFGSGKSILVNALIGHALGDSGEPLLPVGVVPTPARPVRLSYASVVTIVSIQRDGSPEMWSLPRFREENRFRAEDEVPPATAKVSFFDIGYPSDLLATGICFVDTPGRSNDPRNDPKDHHLVQTADAVIVIMRGDMFGSQSDMELIQTVEQSGRPCFKVITRMDLLRPEFEPKIKEVAWRKLVRGVHNASEAESGSMEALAEHQIYFVDARAALEARLHGRVWQVQESGLCLLEEALRNWHHLRLNLLR